MNKIRAAIIHWLGGYTEDNVQNVIVKAQTAAINVAFTSFINRVREFDGLPAEKWCKQVWNLAEKYANAKVSVSIEKEDGTTKYKAK